MGADLTDAQLASLVAATAAALTRRGEQAQTESHAKDLEGHRGYYLGRLHQTCESTRDALYEVLSVGGHFADVPEFLELIEGGNFNKQGRAALAELEESLGVPA